MSLIQTTIIGTDLAESVKRQFGDTSGAQLTDADILRWINEATREIGAALKPIKGISTTASVAGQSRYVLPNAEAIQIESIHYDGIKIEAVLYATAEERISLDPQRTATGFPSFWYEWAGTVSFWPTPVDSDKVIDVFYTKMPERMTALTEYIPLPDKHYDTIFAYVMAKAYELDEEFNEANNQRQSYLNRINEQADEDLAPQKRTYSTINFLED